VYLSVQRAGVMDVGSCCVSQCTVNWCNGRGELLCISVYSELV